MSGEPTIRMERRVLASAHRFPRHAHQDWSIAIVRAGVGYLRCDKGLHQAGPGAMTVLHPGEAHDGWTHAADGLDYAVLAVDEATAAQMHGQRGTPFFPEQLIFDAELASAVWRIAAAGVGGAPVDLIEFAVRRLFRRHARGGHPGDDPSAVTAIARRYIDECYTGRVSLAGLATLADVSRATLVRRFRAETGLSPYGYLVSRRVDVAAALLRSGRSVTEAAALAGFADQSHLHRHFRRILGVTPGRFRASQ